MTSIVEGCVYILLGDLKELEIKIRGTLRGGGVGAFHDHRCFLGGGLRFFVCVLDALSTLLGKLTCYVFCHGTSSPKGGRRCSARFRKPRKPRLAEARRGLA